jgi:hypothetical protein
VPPSLSVEPARPEDYPRIAELTVGVYVDGGLATPAYAPELADVEGRASRSELLVVRDTAGRVVGSVALVLAATSATSRHPTPRQRSACWWSTRTFRAKAWAGYW